MQATLNVVTKIIAFADEQISSNPRLRFVDWLRDVSGASVNDPKSEGHRLLPGETLTVFNGTRATTIDGSTAMSLALLPVEDASRYRITATGGTSPGFRIGRNLTPTGIQLDFTVNANATMSVHSVSPLFGAVLAGDMVFIPSTPTGDSANVISVINSGYWIVLSVAGNQDITLVRPAGQDFEGITESAIPSSDNQFRAFSPNGVQIGDSVDISAGFAVAAQRTFEVVAVTDVFVEIVSTDPLPNQTGIYPGPSGMAFYSETKQFLYVESSQEIVVRVNGDTGNYQRITPVDSSDPNKPGSYMRRGPTWSLVLYNRSPVTASVTIIHAE